MVKGNLLLGRLRWLLAACIVLIAALFLLLLIDVQVDTDSSLNNVLIFALVNLNVIGLLVLVFLVGRNVVKLIFERREGILGAKLRARLVGAFVLIACVPMSISFVVSSGLINEAMEGWFNTQIDNAVTSALTIARQHLASVKSAVRLSTGEILEKLEASPDVDQGGDGLSKLLEQLRHGAELYSLKIISSDGVVLAAAAHAAAAVDPFKEPRFDIEAVHSAARGVQVLRIEERGASQFVRLYSPFRNLVLVSAHRMDPEIVQAQAAVNESFNEYEQLKLFKHPLKFNFLLTLGFFNLLTLFGATWVAFFIAKQITGPIQRLAEGTKNVAKGNYDFAIEPIRDDEIGFLVGSFNSMLHDLRASRDEAERRGLLIQAILANLAVGVIALDPERRVTTVNEAASELLSIDTDSFVSGTPLIELLHEEDYKQIEPVLSALGSEDEAVTSAEIEMRMHHAGRQLLVVCTGGRIRAQGAGGLGLVLIFDDITELSRVQHLAAWRDVARRIAHEIKNPLTPIQLSAQRLERLLASHEASSAVQELTRTIVEHVAIIKRLANEFSEYGRMPTAQFAPSDLAVLLKNTIDTFRVDHPDIAFTFQVDGKLPEMLLDPEQIRGVFINLINNAIGAAKESSTPQVSIQASFDRTKRRATIEVRDTGPGISVTDKNRIFEPYFTTKKGGTGLGLAIVSSIISDHQGEVRVFDNEPRGARFTVMLPQHPLPSTARKLVAS